MILAIIKGPNITIKKCSSMFDTCLTSDCPVQHVWNFPLKNLHDKFNVEPEYTCAYETFTRNVPFNVQKPEPSGWGTRLISICLNPELKLESLRANKKEHFKWDEIKD